MKTRSKRPKDTIYDKDDIGRKVLPWFTALLSDFGLKPVRVRKYHHGISCAISTFDPRLRFDINHQGFIAWGLHLHNYRFDRFADIDLIIRRKSKKYYCDLCQEEKLYYSTVWELWRAHQTPLVRDFIKDELLPAKEIIYMNSLRNGKLGGISDCLLDTERMHPQEAYELKNVKTGESTKPDGWRVFRFPVRQNGDTALSPESTESD